MGIHFDPYTTLMNSGATVNIPASMGKVIREM
jgi:hypothetical protein